MIGYSSAERARGFKPRAEDATGGKDKKKISPGALQEARALIWLHRRRLGLGLGLMVINRLAGLVLPTTSKYLMDNVVLQNQWDLLPKLAMAAAAATLVESVDLVLALAGARRRRAAGDHRDAQGRRGARDAPAGPLLRLDEDRRPHLAHHDRRRRHPEPGRHRPRAADRVGPHGPAGVGRPALSQLEADGGHHAGARHLRHWHGDGVQAAAAAVPRARPDQRRGHGPARRVARRRAHREGLHCREARGADLREGRAPHLPQRRAVAHRRVQRHRLLHRRPRADRHLDDAGRRQLDPGRRDDDRRLRHVPHLHRAHRRAGGAAGQHRHADHRGVRRARPHSRDPPDGDRRPGGRLARAAAGTARRRRVRQCELRIQPGRAGAEAHLLQAPRPAPRRRWSDRAARARARSSGW